MGVTNYLLTGMILQVEAVAKPFFSPRNLGNLFCHSCGKATAIKNGTVMDDHGVDLSVSETVFFLFPFLIVVTMDQIK